MLTWFDFLTSDFTSDFFFFLLDSDSEDDCRLGEEFLFDVLLLELKVRNETFLSILNTTSGTSKSYKFTSNFFFFFFFFTSLATAQIRWSVLT